MDGPEINIIVRPWVGFFLLGLPSRVFPTGVFPSRFGPQLTIIKEEFNDGTKSECSLSLQHFLKKFNLNLKLNIVSTMWGVQWGHPIRGYMYDLMAGQM